MGKVYIILITLIGAAYIAFLSLWESPKKTSERSITAQAVEKNSKKNKDWLKLKATKTS